MKYLHKRYPPSVGSGADIRSGAEPSVCLLAGSDSKYRASLGREPRYVPSGSGGSPDEIAPEPARCIAGGEKVNITSVPGRDAVPALTAAMVGKYLVLWTEHGIVDLLVDEG